MINATPTLPDDLSILLGVAYILMVYISDGSGEGLPKH